MKTYIKNPIGKELAKINEQYIEYNIEILQDYFQREDDIGMMCNKDNIEEYFDRWLEQTDYSELVEIIKSYEN